MAEPGKSLPPASLAAGSNGQRRIGIAADTGEALRLGVSGNHYETGGVRARSAATRTLGAARMDWEIGERDAQTCFRQYRHAVAFLSADEAGLVGFRVQLIKALNRETQRINDPVELFEVSEGTDVQPGGECLRDILRDVIRTFDDGAGGAAETFLPEILVLGIFQLADHLQSRAAEQP